MGLFDRYSDKRAARLEKQVNAAEKRKKVEDLEMKLFNLDRDHYLYLYLRDNLKEGRKLRKISRETTRAEVKAKKAKAVGKLENARTTIYSARADRKKRKLENQRYRNETRHMREVRKDRPDPTPIYVKSGGNWNHSHYKVSSSSYKK